MPARPKITKVPDETHTLIGEPNFDPANPAPWDGMSREQQDEYNRRYGSNPIWPIIAVEPPTENEQ